MKKFLFIFFALLFIWDRATRKYLNPYKLYFLFGAKGSGKTITETKLAYRYLKKGWTVYSDLPELQLPGVRFFSTSDLGDFVPEANSLLILGEVGTKWDKRNFKSFPPQLRDFFVFQRKYRVVCYMDSQSYDVDLKIRDRCDGMFLCTRWFRVFSVAKRIAVKPQIIEASADQPARIADNLVIGLPHTWMWTFIPRWIGLYDTDYILNKKPELPFWVVPDLPVGASRRAHRAARALDRAVHKRVLRAAKANFKRDKRFKRCFRLHRLLLRVSASLPAAFFLHTSNTR